MDKTEYALLYDDPNMYDQWDIGPDHPRSKFLLSCVQGPRVIEFGCGGSGFLRLLVNDYECAAIDINPKWIELGRARLPQVTYTHTLIEDFRTSDTYDSVVLMEVLEHVLDPIAVLLKAKSVLASDGRVLISVPKEGGPWDHTDNHLRQYTAEMLKEHTIIAKFSDAEIWEEGDYVYGLLYP